MLRTIVCALLLLSVPALAALDCSRSAGTLPNPKALPGAVDKKNPIEHIIVIMQENHSFDTYFGALNDPKFYGKDLDGVSPALTVPDLSGKPVSVYHETNLCIADPGHDWNAVHKDLHGGLLDGFIRVNTENGNSGTRVLGYYDATDLPYYYALANQFAIGDRFFCSALTQTFPNRFYFMTGTSFGHIFNDLPTQGSDDFTQKTVFELLNENHISWKYYTDSEGYVGGKGYLSLFQSTYKKNTDKIVGIKDYQNDLLKGTLPQVSFVDSEMDTEDEHPNANVQQGQAWVASRIKELTDSPLWKSSVLFLTYDENGGFYDHVVPPAACAPDDIKPLLHADSMPGDFSHYGFRVPFVAISPFAKHHFVSHRIYDHTSILKYIETKFNLPALTARDANADAFSDVFDYEHPIFEVKDFPSAAEDPTRACKPSN